MNTLIPDVSAIVVKPKQKFLDWLASEQIKNHIPKETFDVLTSFEPTAFRRNSSVIAIPLVTTSLKEVDGFIEANPDKILSIELSRWGLKTSVLPSTNKLDLVREWFDITFHAQLFGITD
jgi:hypothetical protein